MMGQSFFYVYMCRHWSELNRDRLDHRQGLQIWKLLIASHIAVICFGAQL